jgi:hypothetical protein
LSTRVRIVSEDPLNDRYILEPLVKRMLQTCGKPRGDAKVIDNPRTKGYEHAKELLRTELLDRYRHMDLLLFLPDADGKDRSGEFQVLEEEAQAHGVHLLCCAAREEVEVWLLAGHRDKLDQLWQEVRADISVKENVFEPFLAVHGNPKAPGKGRELLMKETLNGYGALLQRCPELKELEERICAILQKVA